MGGVKPPQRQCMLLREVHAAAEGERGEVECRIGYRGHDWCCIVLQAPADWPGHPLAWSARPFSILRTSVYIRGTYIILNLHALMSHLGHGPALKAHYHCHCLPGAGPPGRSLGAHKA